MVEDSTDARNAHPTEHELLAIAKAWAKTIVSNDAAGMASYVTEDWVIVSETGVTSGLDLLALVADGDLTHSAMDIVDQTRIRVFGETAVLTSRITNTAHYLGHQHDADEWTTDVFVRHDGRWLCALTHITPVSQPADGAR